MSISKFALPILFYLLCTEFAFAMVDMKNANFNHTWIDMEVPGNGYQLKVERTYNSRSLFNGIFGFGWCSDFETYLEVNPEGNLRIKECGAGQEIVYSPRDLNHKEVEIMINQIIDKVKAERKSGATETFIKQLREDLAGDDGYRLQYATKYGLQSKIKEGTKFFANGREVESILLEKSYYTRTLADGSLQRFDLQGRLTHFYDKNGNFLKLEHDKDLLISVVDSTSRKLVFRYDNNKKLKSITGPNNLTAEYKFSNLDDLSWVKNSWKNIYTYNYDDLHNMTKATWPDNTTIAIGYDKTKDWVLEFTDRDKCVENYNYETNKEDPRSHYWSTVIKKCKNKVVADNKYEFWYKKREDGNYILNRVVTKIDTNTTDITYHELFGKPISIRKNNDISNFEYYPDGLVRTKTNQELSFSYEYEGKTKKISKVTTNIINNKGKVISSKATEFQYDSKGNLIFAKNTEGQKINMTYDDRGRIATIVDQSKKIVKIQYEEKFGKPSILTRTGVGTVRILYKNSGEISKFESKGPSEAKQIISAFNNLLDIIAPATQELYL